MALLEINLKKPALVEERKPHAEAGTGSSSSSSRSSGSSSKGSSSSGSSGRSTGKSLLGLLLLAVVGAAAAKAVRSRRSDPTSYEEEDEPNPIIGAEAKRESSGWRRRVGGLLGAVAVLALLVRTVRGRSE